MAQTSWPFENIDTSETQFSQWARNIGEGIISGATLELEPFADSSGMQVKVKSGQALIRGHYYDNTAEETLAIATANVSNPRIDRVVLRLDPTANSVVLAVLTGTPASSPVAPDVTQTDGGVYEISLALVDVPAAAVLIIPANVTDTRAIFSPWTGSVSGDDITGTIPSSKLAVAVSEKSANYSILATDANSTIFLTGGTGRTFTIDNVLSAGQRIDFVQDGSGQITFAAGSGVTLNSKGSKLKTSAQYSGASVVCRSSGVYYLVGDLG
jgi:hypothetical protein